MTYFSAPSNAHMTNYWAVTFADKPVSPLGETNISETVYVMAWSETDLQEKIGRLFRGKVVALIEPDFTAQVQTVDTYNTTTVRDGEHSYKVPDAAITKIEEPLRQTIEELRELCEQRADEIARQERVLRGYEGDDPEPVV